MAEEEPHLRRDAIKRDAPGGGGASIGMLGGVGGTHGGLADPAAPQVSSSGFAAAVSTGRTAKLAAVRAAYASCHGQLGIMPSSVPLSSLISEEESIASVALGLSQSQYVGCKRMLVLTTARQAPALLSAEQAVVVLKAKLDERRSRLLHRHCVHFGWIGA